MKETLCTLSLFYEEDKKGKSALNHYQISLNEFVINNRNALHFRVSKWNKIVVMKREKKPYC